MSDKLQWCKPYKREKSGMLGNYITYESDVLITNLSFEQSIKLIGLLNGAYNQGRYRELLNKEK